MAELLLRPRPKLLTFRLDEADAGGAAGTMLEAVEKAVTAECRLVSLSTLVCRGADTGGLTVEGTEV